MKKLLFFFAITLFIAGCAGNAKKVLVLSHNGTQINEDAKTIDCKATSGHEEKILDVSGDVTYKVSTAAGDAAINLPAKGYYVMNLNNNDTIIGAYQPLRSANQAGKIITQVELKQKIDSLQQLLQGKNVSEANRNFFILPNTAAKISDNENAIIVAPFHQMTSFTAGEDGKDPEVYRFYTAGELREMINTLVGHTKAEETPPPPPAK